MRTPNAIKFEAARDELLKHVGLLEPFKPGVEADDVADAGLDWDAIARSMDTLIQAAMEEVKAAGGRKDRYTAGIFVDLIDDALGDALLCLQRQIEDGNTPTARAERRQEAASDLRREDAA